MKKLLFVLILLLGAVAGTGYYFYNKITCRPSWYQADPAQRKALPAVDLEAMEKRIKNDFKRGKAVTIPVDQLVSAGAGQNRVNGRRKPCRCCQGFFGLT